MSDNEIALYGKPKKDIIDHIENSGEFKSYGIRVTSRSPLCNIIFTRLDAYLFL